ncbi:histone H1-like [Argonauta hians]
MSDKPKTAAKPKPKAPAKHPKFKEMIKAGLVELKGTGGTSRVALEKYILANYNVEKNATFQVNLKRALKAGVENNALVRTKGVGASGSFKLAKAEKAKKPAAKKTAAKKPAAKKPASKKTAKSPKAKKTVKKTAKKSPAKKAVKKSPAKKPAKKVVKKSPAKKAVKKPAKKAAKK